MDTFSRYTLIVSKRFDTIQVDPHHLNTQSFFILIPGGQPPGTPRLLHVSSGWVGRFFVSALHIFFIFFISFSEDEQTLCTFFLYTVLVPNKWYRPSDSPSLGPQSFFILIPGGQPPGTPRSSATFTYIPPQRVL